MTLTVNPARGQSPEARAQELSDAFKVLVKRARRKWTKAPLEYLAVFEETKKGEPHLHILARAPFIPQSWLSTQMSELIAAPIVDIRRVGAIKNAARYVAKYVGKGPKPFAKLKRYWQSARYNLKPREPRHKDEVWGSGWRVIDQSIYLLAENWRALGHVVESLSEHEIFSPVLPAGP